MISDGGVRTIVAGGRPEAGPMQAVSGTRSAASYSAANLENDFYFARAVNDIVDSQGPPDYDTEVLVSYAGISLREQVRANDTKSLQFQYLAADCRIYYTLQNWNNYTQLWLDAAEATWDDPSRCVADSTGYSKRGQSQPDKLPPRRPSRLASYITQGLALANDDINTSPLGSKAIHNPPIEAQTGIRQSNAITLCSGTNGACSCPGNLYRRPQSATCNLYDRNRRFAGTVNKDSFLCLPTCTRTALSDSCEEGAKCQSVGATGPTTANAAYAYGSQGQGAGTTASELRCVPSKVRANDLVCNPQTQFTSSYGSIGKRGLD